MNMNLLRVATIAAAAISYAPTAFGVKICYPSDCTSYTAVSPSTSQAQLTEWTTSVWLDKFDTRNGVRVLDKITLKTTFKFETDSYVTCTNTDSYCTNTYSGTAKPGVEFKLDLAAHPNQLSQFWGRWGDHPATPAIPGQDYTNPANPVPMFVPYTYPLFDIVGYTPDLASNGGTVQHDDCEVLGCTVWGYYKPTAGGAATFYYGNNAFGTIVTRDPNVGSGTNTYTQSDYSASTGVSYKFGQGSNPVVSTPKDVEVHLGKTSYEVTAAAPLKKSISRTDQAGGIGQNIAATTILGLFTGSGQIEFTANAKGFIQITDIGGNSAKRQVTSAYIAMSVEYDYSYSGVNGDPQFAGFHGQQFQVHGYPGSYFHLISAPKFQMNGRFAYIANGHCHYKHTPCWSHPGTYIDDVTMVVDELLVRITAGPVGVGYSVSVNDEPFHGHGKKNINETNEFVPTKFYANSTRLSIHFRSSLQVSIHTDLFSITINNADDFFNIETQLLARPILQAGREVDQRYPHPQTGKPWFPTYPIHGFIGQTWANATYANKKYYQGDVDDYVETRPYSTDSIYSQYNKKFDEKNMIWE